MFRTAAELWRGEQGAVVSSELALIIGMVVLAADGLVVGLSDLRDGINSELTRIGAAIGSIPVSYSFTGMASCSGRTTGSSYTRVSLEPAVMWSEPASCAVYSCDALVPAYGHRHGGVAVELEVVPE